MFLDSGKCFWILESVLGSGKCFWILGSFFGFWAVFWILGSVLSLRATLLSLSFLSLLTLLLLFLLLLLLYRCDKECSEAVPIYLKLNSGLGVTSTRWSFPPNEVEAFRSLKVIVYVA